MSALDLDGLERLAAAATAGPWAAGGSVFDGERVTDQVWLWEETGHHPGDPDASDTRIAIMPRADGELTAALRNAAPKLLAIARLIETLGLARAECGARGIPVYAEPSDVEEHTLNSIAALSDTLTPPAQGSE